jgi:hypothetical protein
MKRLAWSLILTVTFFLVVVLIVSCTFDKDHHRRDKEPPNIYEPGGPR